MTSARPPFAGRTRIAAALFLCLAVAAAYATGRTLPAVEAIEGQSLDWRFRFRGPLAPGPETVLVLIDDKSLAASGQRVPSRRDLARAVEILAAAGARVIALDLLLVGRENAETDTGDRALGEVLQGTDNVIVPFAFVFDSEDANTTGLTPEIEAAAFRVVQAPAGRSPDLEPRPVGLLVPAPDFRSAGLGAHVNVVLAADGKLRFHHPAMVYGGRFFPSLPIESLRRYLGVARDRVALRFEEAIVLGDHEVPTDRAMRVAVNFHGGPGTFPGHSFVDLIEGRLEAEAFADRVVLIGATAQGFGDRFATPFSPVLPGVEVFATVIDNLLHGRWLVREPWVQALDLLAILLCGLAGGALAWLGRPLAVVSGAIALFGAWFALTLLAFRGANLWLDFTFPSLALVLSGGLALLGRLAAERGLRRRAERQREGLARYLPAALSEDLDEEGHPAAREHTHYAAIMFVDMVGFTGLSESLAPRETMALLRDFHREVETKVLAHGGVIDKFIGDAVLVVFGLRESRPEDPAKALACARDLAGNPNLGIGLHFGPVAVGEVGGETQAQLTVTGDAVNVASRLQALTRDQGTAILASDALIEAVRAQGGASLLNGFEERPLQAIRGRRRPLGIWAWRPESIAQGE